MSHVIGIDLGTTNTVVSVVRDGQASALSDDAQQTLIPSVVSFHPNGNVLVGRPAKERRVVDATSTIYSIKRLIGRSWDSEEVRRARSRFPFEMREGPGQAALVVARGETYTLPEISAFVLRKAKSVAEAALGTTVDRAVITVPANFNDLQRAATKVAGRVAGLEVLRILNEPTAAALAYGYGRASSERVAVYDFGGGTFDVTLLDLSNNVFEVLATAGNTFLGGDDVDLAIAERMAELLIAQHRIDARADLQVFERLRAAAETLKHRLSSETEVHVSVPEIGHALGGKPIDFAFSMTRPELERLVAPIVDRTFDVCREALGIARLSTNDFDQVLLVGGSTRIPLVRRRVEEFFQKPLKANINPDEVVAIGAAIQASALSGAEKRKGTIPPAPSPAARQTQPNFSDAPRVGDAGRKRVSTEPHVIAPGPARPRFQSSPAIPSTQPFFGRPHTATTPGIAPGSNRPAGTPSESTLGALGKAPSNTPPSTLGGLGPRQRVKTGPGLGPEAQRVVSAPTLASASDEARGARELLDEELGLPLVGVPSVPIAADPIKPNLDPQQIAQRFGKLPGATPPPAREESVAFSLGDADFLEVDSAPAASQRTVAGYAAPVSATGFDDEDALPMPELPEEEITHVSAPPEPSAPQASASPQRPASPFAGATLLGTAPASAAANAGARPGATLLGTAPPSSARIGAPIIPAYAQPPPATAVAPPRTVPLPAAAPPSAGTLSGNPFGPAPAPPNYAPPQPSYAPPAYSGFEPVPVSRSAPPAPLLIDVTPLTLAVETVNGFCDPVIERNTQVPCERTRVFVTARDNQTKVSVRIAQGESSQFANNTLLGEVELSQLSLAPRGEVQIAVSFSLDTNGMLDVSAKEVATGRATATRVRLVALPEANDIARMTQRNAARQM